MLQRDTVTPLYLVQNWMGNTLVKVSDRYDTYAAIACKTKKCHFSRKFDVWPDLTRSNVDLGLKTICAITISRRDASAVFFLRSSTTIRGRSPRGVAPTPLHWRRWRNTENGRGLTGWDGFGRCIRLCRSHGFPFASFAGISMQIRFSHQNLCIAVGTAFTL